jgi:hypothetical protein
MKRRSSKKRKSCRQITLPATNMGGMELHWNGERDHNIAQKHSFTAKVFLAGTRTFGFLTEVLCIPSQIIKFALSVVQGLRAKV